MKNEVQGKIQSVEPSGGNMKVTLDDGTQLTIPASVNFQRADLKEWATMKASYEEKGGQKVVTAIQVRPAS